MCCLPNRQVISTDEGADYISADVTMTGLADGTGSYTGLRHLAVSALWFVWSEAQVERRSSVTASLRGYSPSMRIISRRCGSLLNQIPSDPREAGPWLRQSKDAGLAGLDVDHSWILKGATPIRPLCLRSVVSEHACADAPHMGWGCTVIGSGAGFSLSVRTRLRL